MKKTTVAILLSCVGGILMATAMRLNASLGHHIGLLESAFVVHVVGTVASILFLFFLLQIRLLSGWRQAPKLSYLNGVLGVLIVVISNLAVLKLGMVLSIGLFMTGNLVFSVVADHFGWLGLPVFIITPRRLLGLFCSVVGVLLVL